MNFTGCKVYGSAGQQYTVEKVIGKGSFATVYRAIREDKKEVLAVKVVDKKRLARKGVENQLREIEIMRTVKHPNVMNLVDLLESDTHLFLITRFMAGGELFDKIVSRGHFTEADAVGILRQIASGISYLHDNGICHRDLKPENLLCSAPEGRDEQFEVVITDFGFSKLFGRGELMKTSCGTLHYAAPEILLGRPYTEACDQWAFGVITYVVLTGCFPFDGPSDVLGQKILSAEYNQTNLDARHVTPAARSFIANLLVVDAARRMTAKMCLAHPWMNPQAGTPAAPEVDLTASRENLQLAINKTRGPRRV